MLVDNKFLYISLPRCGSTSFHYSCILNGLSVKNLNPQWSNHNNSIDFHNIEESDIMNSIIHGHESLSDLQKKFGFDLPVISVIRDRHESFFSLYKHIIYDTDRTGWHDFAKWFSTVGIDELFFFQAKDLYSINKRWDIINEFLIKNKFIKGYVKNPTIHLKNPTIHLSNECLLINILEILIAPKSVWHNHDKNIIWFNIDEMSKMEDWVSKITDKNFKLKHVNSHSHIKTNLQLNEEFKNKYNSIYDYYDLPKSKKTLI
jgi:hypothetical protein